ncbi:MAG: enoyl-CoA hydratase/isomerase family protein [Acidimicrobiales bacterium]|nr:enoyl-CoA hydratase/isomerase family protein [Acidimicrobiales bacterium]
MTDPAAGSDHRVRIDRHPLPDAAGREGGDACTAVVVLDRPDVLNAMDWQMLHALDDAFDQIEADQSVRTVLLTGAGRAFSAGGDLTSYLELQRDTVRFPRFVADVHRVFGRCRLLPVPVIALVNGVTAAGGLELLLNCDFALAAGSARIGDAHLNFGQMGGGGVLTLLPRAIGRERAAELIFSGRFLDADVAADWGLVNRVVPDDQLLEAGLDLAAGIAAKSPLAVANAKEVLQAIWSDNAGVDAGLRYERERNSYYCLTSADAPEGLAAFQEKRTPRFHGR